MENSFSFHKLNNLQNMMINIMTEGKEEVFKSFEVIKNPLERCKQRKLYHFAIQKFNKGK